MPWSANTSLCYSLERLVKIQKFVVYLSSFSVLLLSFFYFLFLVNSRNIMSIFFLSFFIVCVLCLHVRLNAVVWCYINDLSVYCFFFFYLSAYSLTRCWILYSFLSFSCILRLHVFSLSFVILFFFSYVVRIWCVCLKLTINHCIDC